MKKRSEKTSKDQVKDLKHSIIKFGDPGHEKQKKIDKLQKEVRYDMH